MRIQNGKTDNSDRLSAIREEIDGIDDTLLELLNRRAKCSLEVGELKAETGAPVFRPMREGLLLEKLTNANKGPLPDTHLRAIFREIISSSRALQMPLKVAFLGPEGTYSHLAALEFLGSSMDFSPMSRFEDIFKAVESGTSQTGVIPLENSLHGTVLRCMDLFAAHDVRIRAEWFSRISHSVLSREDSLGAVKTVYSHAQALGQCAEWLRANLPEARLVSVESTAAAAHKVLAESGSAAIAHHALASRLGLSILAQGVEDINDNWTRFVAIGPAEIAAAGKARLAPLRGRLAPPDPAEIAAAGKAIPDPHSGRLAPPDPAEIAAAGKAIPDPHSKRLAPPDPAEIAAAEIAAPLKTSVLFTLPDKPGALASVLERFAQSGVNMNKLESRPLKSERWKYIFFCDVSCDLTAQNHTPLLRDLRGLCHGFRILGAYPAGIYMEGTCMQARGRE